MSFATMKPLSMSTTKGYSLISLTPIFNTTNKPISSSYTYLSKTPSNPIKLNLSCSYSSSSSLPHFLSLKKKKPHFPNVVSVLTEDDTVVLEDPEQESEELFNLEGNFEDGSEEEVVEEEGFVEAVGDSEESDEAEAEEEEEEYVEPPEEAKLFVGNLPYDIDSEGLARLFEKAGVVEIAEVIYNRVTEQSRGFGFVTMSTVEEAEKGVELYNRHDLSGRLLTVNKAAPRGSQPERPPRTYEPSFRMYVGNIPWDLDDARLEQIFSEHGKVVTARVVYDRETGRSRGFGFVSMSSEAEMNDAIAKLDGESFNGRSIRVNVAEERPKRNTF